jgi:hypothetical protein
LHENSAKFGVSFLHARLHGSWLSKTGKSKIKKAVKHLYGQQLILKKFYHNPTRYLSSKVLGAIKAQKGSFIVS